MSLTNRLKSSDFGIQDPPTPESRRKPRKFQNKITHDAATDDHELSSGPGGPMVIAPSTASAAQNTWATHVQNPIVSIATSAAEFPTWPASMPQDTRTLNAVPNAYANLIAQPAAEHRPRFHTWSLGESDSNRGSGTAYRPVTPPAPDVSNSDEFPDWPPPPTTRSESRRPGPAPERGPIPTIRPHSKHECNSWGPDKCPPNCRGVSAKPRPFTLRDIWKLFIGHLKHTGMLAGDRMEEQRLWAVCRLMEEQGLTGAAELERLECWQLDAFGLVDEGLQHELRVVLGSCTRWEAKHGTGVGS